MTTNLRLLIARRRDRQLSGLQAFLELLDQAVCGLSCQIRMIEAETSVWIEQSLSTYVQQRITTGTLIRDTELTWDQVSDRLHKTMGFNKEKERTIYLSHYEDFLFQLPFAIFVENACKLVELDGDTVYAVSNDLKWGFGIDMYTSERSNAIRFTVDTWTH